MPQSMPSALQIASLADFVRRHPRLFVLSGAGISTSVGIPDYRDAEGQWKQSQPVQFDAFMSDVRTRQRYWARSLVGWRHFGAAAPSAAHAALARLEALGFVDLLCTQNVDGLHQRAGSRQVVDLHGRLDTVRCMHCTHRGSRADLQRLLESRNPSWLVASAPVLADGDVRLEGDFSDFDIPPCPACGGVLKPDVVFFGEQVPRDRVDASYSSVQRADAVLVVGTSLMVYSGFRFVEAAASAGKPVAAINLGRTRADPLLSLKIVADTDSTLPALLALLEP